MILHHEFVLANALAFNETVEWLTKTGQPFLLIGVIISLVWNVAVCHTQFKHLRTNMVTKKDLELAKLNLISELKAWADEKFVTERECATRISTLGPIHGSGGNS